MLENKSQKLFWSAEIAITFYPVKYKTAPIRKQDLPQGCNTARRFKISKSQKEGSNGHTDFYIISFKSSNHF